jgi:hypothetical protein
MSDTNVDTEKAELEAMHSVLFLNLISQQTNMAFLFLGRVAHPQTGEVVQDFDSAKFFIDQLEMLEVKTKGNLDKREESMLKQSLTNLRMAFFESVENPMKFDEKGKPILPAEPAKPEETKAPEAAPAEPTDEESKKRFSKKY